MQFRLRFWAQNAGQENVGLNQSINQKRIRVTKVTNVTARPRLNITKSQKQKCIHYHSFVLYTQVDVYIIA